MYNIDEQVELKLEFGSVKLEIELFSAKTFGFDERCYEPLIINLQELFNKNSLDKKYVFSQKSESNLCTDFGLLDLNLKLLSSPYPLVGGIFSRLALKIKSLQ